MKFQDTPIQDVVLIEPQIFGDARGFFLESWQSQKFAAAGIAANFVQDNHSRSSQWTLRGLHFQTEHTQGKLVRVTAGSVFDMVVDLRRSSRTFGAWWGVELSAENHLMLWVPKGLAHGILVTSDQVDFLYKCTDIYSPAHERTLAVARGPGSVATAGGAAVAGARSIRAWQMNFYERVDPARPPRRRRLHPSKPGENRRAFLTRSRFTEICSGDHISMVQAPS